MRCLSCKAELDEIVDDVERMDWLQLMHYFHHELDEGEITQATHNTMTSALMTFKPLGKDEEN